MLWSTRRRQIGSVNRSMRTQGIRALIGAIDGWCARGNNEVMLMFTVAVLLVVLDGWLGILTKLCLFLVVRLLSCLPTVICLHPLPLGIARVRSFMHTGECIGIVAPYQHIEPAQCTVRNHVNTGLYFVLHRFTVLTIYLSLDVSHLKLEPCFPFKNQLKASNSYSKQDVSLHFAEQSVEVHLCGEWVCKEVTEWTLEVSETGGSRQFFQIKGPVWWKM